MPNMTANTDAIFCKCIDDRDVVVAHARGPAKSLGTPNSEILEDLGAGD
jgi:hypothetical protein